MSYAFKSSTTENGISKALKLYTYCLEIIARGEKHIMIQFDLQNTSSVVIIEVVSHLRGRGFKAGIITKTETEEDTFHNHTYEVEKTYLVINVSKSKL